MDDEGLQYEGFLGGKVIELFYIMMGGCLLDSICLLKLRLFSHYRV